MSTPLELLQKEIKGLETHLSHVRKELGLQLRVSRERGGCVLLSTASWPVIRCEKVSAKILNALEEYEASVSEELAAKQAKLDAINELLSKG